MAITMIAWTRARGGSSRALLRSESGSGKSQRTALFRALMHSWRILRRPRSRGKSWFRSAGVTYMKSPLDALRMGQVDFDYVLSVAEAQEWGALF